MSYPPGSQGVIDRRMLFCEKLLTSFSTNELITECPDCFRFTALCCQHSPSICHHFALVFTDGSCLNNGQAGSTSGIGIAIGSIGIGEDQWSIPVDDSVDSNPKRTSQRAELLAAMEGLRRISLESGLHHSTERHTNREPQCWIIVTDSEYVVRGMTEWLPGWKDNRWRTAKGTTPSNVDLFQALDSLIRRIEKKHPVLVGFWHVPREYNQLADSLARRAAQLA